MFYIRTRSLLANLLEWDLGGVINENRNPENPTRTPTGTRMSRPTWKYKCLLPFIKSEGKSD